MSTATVTLETATQKASKRWEGSRGKNSQESQLKQALNTLLEVIGPTSPRALAQMTIADITTEMVAECVDIWASSGLSASTINSRLSVLGVLGITTTGCWRKNRLPPKWWLKETDCARLLPYLRATPAPFPHSSLLADYVEFVSHTGLRVEEALRLAWSDVSLNLYEAEDGKVRSQSEMTVPGTKTRHSRATLALGVAPSLLLLRREKEKGSNINVFPIRYDPLHLAWDKAREFLGVADNPMATLKALRRTAARHLTVNGMPTEMVREYLRHNNIKTTMGYLHLVGGYSTEEQRRWLV